MEKLRRHGLHDGVRQGVRILVTARASMDKDRTRSINTLNALVRGNHLSIDARKKLTDTQITEVSKWRSREEELSLSIARPEAVRLAKHVLELTEQLTANEQQLEETGFRAISAAKRLPRGRTRAGSAARRHSPPWPERIRSPRPPGTRSGTG